MNHQQAQELLPWLANESLAPNDRDALRVHAEHCDECGADLELLGVLRSISATRQASEPVYRAGVLDGVLAQLADTPQLQPVAAVPRRERTSARQRLQAWLALQFEQWVTPQRMRSALIAQCAVIAVLAGVLVLGDRVTTDSEQDYETVSAPVLGDVAIAFRPDATEAEIRAVLVAADATVVAGPSAVGIYRLTLSRDAALRVAMAQLSASELVIYLEPVAQP
ncbi:MAG: hypothetical protein AB8B93_06770 [Pseudomonadales bacterium]